MSLDSEYFAKNYEFLVDPTEREFLIVEEFLDAKPLSEVTDRLTTEPAIIDLLHRIMVAMQPVWDQRVVHRDLKPDNILITQDLKPKIVDFGIARFLDYASLTKTIAFMGPATPMYAAPEQLFNLKTEIDVRTDFFALGIIVAELQMRFHPFEPAYVGNQQSIPENIVQGNCVIPSENTGASPDFTYLVRRFLQTEPYRRFRNYRVVMDYLDEHWNPTV
jgi:serine/threonine-protein kinase